jgi:2-succinyl-5-enolpyruvyl-6-hydroxy-3-cyclohexene-1-carboxylate synthase
MSTDAGRLNLQWAEWIVDELVRCGVRHCSFASGSRNAPLVVAAARHGGLAMVWHMDERGAAYYAVGVGRVTGMPAVWITTSGTAAANGLAAAAEASNARVPLILLTADRPPELRDTGANQTIDQVKLFGTAERWQFDLPTPSRDIPREAVLTTVDQAVHRARHAPAGPVHLNCMFREPLLPARDQAAQAVPVDARPDGQPHTSYVAPTALPPVVPVQNLLGEARRVLIVAGELRRREERAAVTRLAASTGWPLLPDVASGLRLGPCAAPRVAYYDQLLLAADAMAHCRPDSVLHVGGPVTSKRLGSFLAACRDATQIRLQDHPLRHDPTHQLRLCVEGDVRVTCEALATALPCRIDPAWAATWTTADERIDAAIETALGAESQLSEPGLARLLSRLVPTGHGLFLGNSMPIRDMDGVGALDGALPEVVVNRGASGIDGNIATAAGAAAGLATPLTAVIGDLACLHDLNGLALLARSVQPVTLIVVNNDGGGVFSFLPVAEHADVFERCFGTPHGLRFEGAAAMFGLPYHRVETPTAFRDAYRERLTSGRSGLIEVAGDRAANQRVHLALRDRVLAAMRDGCSNP